MCLLYHAQQLKAETKNVFLKLIDDMVQLDETYGENYMSILPGTSMHAQRMCLTSLILMILNIYLWMLYISSMKISALRLPKT